MATEKIASIAIGRGDTRAATSLDERMKSAWTDTPGERLNQCQP
jgi:hypothetical protein